MNGYEGRNAVGRWLQIKAATGHIGYACGDNFAPYATPRNVLRQLSADAMHSSLLARLLDGKEPLSEEEYRAAKERGEV